MSTATEREGVVSTLEKMFNATRFEAVCGETVRDKYVSLKHPVTGQVATNGIYGCIESHYQALKELLNSPEEYIGVFEDDCFFTANKEEINSWLQSLPEDWNVVLLGTTQNVMGVKSDSHYKVTRFWGAHAVIFKKSCLDKIFQIYDKYVKKGPLPIPDWWYAWAIQEHNLIAYTPNPPTRFCYQKEGLISYLTGKKRGLPPLPNV